MNRRNFLKTLGAVVGTAIVAPAILLAVKPKNLWMAGKGGSLIEGIDLDTSMNKFQPPLEVVTFRGIPLVYHTPLDTRDLSL